MRVQPGQLVSLGYGKYVRSDEVVAVEPVTEDRGPGRRSLVWVEGIPEPLVASRAHGSIVDDIVTPAEEVARMRQLRSAVSQMANALDQVPPVLRRVIKEESDVDLVELLEEARKVLFVGA
jgi:hypothetical protein